MSAEFGFTDFSQVNFPPIYDQTAPPQYSVDQNLGDINPSDLDYNRYTETNRPVTQRARMFDDNGYYINGPTTQPWNTARTTYDSITALSQSWSDPNKASIANTFARYVSQYGHTNSPGVLWGISQLGIDPNSKVIQDILQVDAEEVQKENVQSQPMNVSSPAANEETGEPGFFDSLLMGAQFASRNAFSLLSSGMEAVQGSMRTVGGALTNDNMTAGERMGAILGAGSFGVISSPLTLAAMPQMANPDNPYMNPWAQTDWGQTIALAREIGFEAFTSAQAGLDVNRAKKELEETNPSFADLTPEEQNALGEKIAKEKSYYAQSGWFVDETSVVGERQRRTTFNTWAIPGPEDEMTAWTLGRGVASNTVGTDSEAYGVVSGTVDAIAAIATDPLTYIPGLGIPSKTVKALTSGKMLIGAEGKAYRALEARVLTNARKAQAAAAKGDTAAARRLAYQALREYNGEAPTTQQVDDVINGMEIVPDVTKLADMTIEEVAEMTKAARESELTSTFMGATKVNKESIYVPARDMRRNTLEVESAQRFIEANVVATGGTSDAVRLADAWDEFIEFGKQNPGVSGNDYLATRFGLDEAGQPLPENAEDYAVFSEVFEMWRVFGTVNDSPINETIVPFGTALRDMASDTRKVRQGTRVREEAIDEDTARILVTQDSEKLFQNLQDQDLSGIVLQGIPTKNVPVAGAYGSDAGVFYYTGANNSSLNIVDAAEIIPEEVKSAVVGRLLDVASRDDMRLVTDETLQFIDYESVAGQTFRQVDMQSDPRGLIRSLLDNPNTTYNELVSTAALIGLDPVLDDILRTAVKKNRIDGVTNLNGVQGRTWLGNSSRVTGFGITDEARVAAAAAKQAPEPIVALAEAGVKAGSTTVLGYKGLRPSDLDFEVLRKTEIAADSRELLQQAASDAMFNGYRFEAQLRAQLDALDAEWVDPVAKMKSVLGWHAGLRKNPLTGFTSDEKGVRSFLFGMGPLSKMGDRSLGVLGDFIPKARREAAIAARNSAVDIRRRMQTLDPNSSEYKEASDEAIKLMDQFDSLLAKAAGNLRMVTGGKWSAELYEEVATNAIEGGGKDGLIRILAPRLGIDVSEGDISKTIISRKGDSKTFLSSRRTVMPKVQRMLGQMPGSRKVNLMDDRDVADNLLNYARYAKLDEDFIALQLGKITLAAGKADQAVVARNALTKTFQQINRSMVERIDESLVTKWLFSGDGGQRRKKEIINALDESTSIYLGGKYKQKDGDLNEIIATSSDVRRFITAEGNEYIMPNAKLDSELADGFVSLPTVEEWADGLRRISLALDRVKPIGDAWKRSLQFYNNFFRTSLLVFRASYMIRNLAEMQVRMFLNGHESVFNDPATMLAMTVGDNWWGKKMAKYNTSRGEAINTLTVQLKREPTEEEIVKLAGPSPKMPKLLESYDRYHQTVLGTDFATGMDIELATANKIKDFWVLIREAHSLTDPRVYSAGVRQGWTPVEYGSKNFAKGWANELMMLQGSEVARLVVGKTSSQQFASLVGGTAGVDVQRSIARELMRDKKYEAFRRKMYAADKEYEKIFSDEEATLEYLFYNQNSVFNRVRLMTNNDSRLLDFIATGKLQYADNATLSPNSFTDPTKRISEFRRVLEDFFEGPEMAAHFRSNKVTVPYLENIDSKQGFGWVNKFFEISSKIERLGAVGPEFRMAYWDRIAELAPGLRGKDVDRALAAAKTTLSPIKNFTGVNIGKNHSAWSALKNAKSNGVDGFMKLDEIHEDAMRYAAEEVAGLFYDAARRNNFWYAMRVAIPFGQAWSNTLETWAKLGAKKPLNIYKAQKLFNALQEEQSNAIYEAGQQFGPLSMYGKYEPGYAPWERDSQGGFFYSNDFGDTVFEVPLAGRALGMSRNLLARLNGVDAGPLMDGNMSVQSPVSSLNLALGGDSIMPGFGPLVSMPLQSDFLPDNKYTGWLRQQAAPFGDRTLVESGTPAWLQKSISGAQAMPGLGGWASSFAGSLFPGHKNRGIVDAMAILSSTGNYPDAMSNPETARRLKVDAEELAAATLLMTGLFQNVMPSTPMTESVVTYTTGEGEEQTTGQYTLGLVNALGQQYYVRNGFDRTAATEEMIRDFGPYAAFAMVGNWSGYSRLPKGQALEWAYDHPEIAESNPDVFTLFFPQGDSSSVEALRWLRKNTFGEAVRKNPDEAFSEAVTFLQRVQISRLNSMEAAGEISSEQAADARDGVREQYLMSGEAAGTFLDRTLELEQINGFVEMYPEVQESQAGKAFMTAWQIRDKAIQHTRAWTGDPDAGLGSERATPVRAAYYAELDKLIQQYPDFILLGNRLRKEWE